MQTTSDFKIAIALGRRRREEPASVHQAAEPRHVALLHELMARREIFLGRRVGDLPVAALVARDAEHRLEHILLANREGGHVGGLVLEARKGGALVVRVIGKHLQAEQRSDCAADLGHGGSIDRDLTIVQERQGAVLEVKPVPVRPAAQAELVPEAVRDADPGALAKLLDLLVELGLDRAENHVLAHFLVQRVAAEVVRQHPGDACGGSGLDELGLRLRRRHDVHGDDEDILALERLDEGLLVAVVDFFRG